MKVLEVIKHSTLDIKLLWASVFLRLMSYGLTNQILTLFLNEIGISETEMGWFMSLTLVGDVCISYVLTWYADVWGRRRILVYGSSMMVLSGLVFSFSENFHLLLLFAIVGVISPSSDEVGPFKSIEEAMIAHLTPHNKRPEVYAMHSFVGTVGSALGSIICGWLIQLLKSYKILSTDLQCYKAIFLVYAVLAVGKVIIMLLLSENSEMDGQHGCDDDELEPAITETTPLVEGVVDISAVSQTRSNKLSPQTVSVLIKLLVIFMIDSFGSGFMTSAWMVYYYYKVFNMTALALGVLFFVTKISMAASSLPSSTVARMFGPVKATLMVQIPSGIFSILIPFAESHLPISIVFLNLYYFTTAMDVTPRQILLTNIVKPRDLTKVMGIVNIGKTFARCIGPIFTGALADRGLLWLCYIISGSLVILADIILGILFIDIDSRILEKTNAA